MDSYHKGFRFERLSDSGAKCIVTYSAIDENLVINEGDALGITVVDSGQTDLESATHYYSELLEVVRSYNTNSAVEAHVYNDITTKAIDKDTIEEAVRKRKVATDKLNRAADALEEGSGDLKTISKDLNATPDTSNKVLADGKGTASKVDESESRDNVSSFDVNSTWYFD